MGCDIHLFVEKKVDDKWVSADKWSKDKYEKDRKEVTYENRFYSGRNYSLFAILANVRNGVGFAGCGLGEGFKPLANPRGLPINVSPQVEQESDNWNGDGHSHSWFTVQELLNYDWTQITTERGWIQAVPYIKWNQWGRKEREAPKDYCGGVGGGNVKHISEKEMQSSIQEIRDEYKVKDDWELIKKLKETNELSHCYCQVSWEIPYYKCCRSFLSDALPQLWKLGKPTNVRIVFWFDN